MFVKRFLMISILVCFLIFFLVMLNCGKKAVAPVSDGNSVNLVKNSSFEENGEPTAVGWEGASSSNLYRDAPPVAGAGEWCLMLSAGCVWQSALYLLDSIEDGGIYELSCWARKEQYGVGGATVGFSRKWEGDFIKSSPVLSKNWNMISLIDTLSIAPGDSIYVMLRAEGGFAGSCTGFFDLVQVIKKN